MKKQKWGNTAGSIAAYQAMYQAQPASADFHSNASENGDPDLFQKCIAEEKAEQERALAPIRAAQAEINKNMRAALGQELLTLPNDPFLAECCKQTEKPNTDEGVRNAFLVFRDVMLPAVITDAGIELLGQVTELNPRVDFASTSPLTFRPVWSRLVDLGLVKEGTHYRGRRPEVEQPPTAEQPLTDREQVEADFQAQYFPLYADWLASMKKAWGFTPSQTQQRYALDVINETGMSPLLHATYDEVRRICCRRNVFPPMLTADELLAEQLNNTDLSNPQSRADYIREANRIRFQSQETE